MQYGVCVDTVLIYYMSSHINKTIISSYPIFIIILPSGRHVFAAESKVDQDSWIDTMNSVIGEDRMRKNKSVKKNTMAELVMREPGDSIGHAPHVGTLMGTLITN